LERRMAALEARLDAMDARFSERFIGIDERFATMRLSMEQFQARMQDVADTMAREIGRLDPRLAALEDGLVRVSHRLAAAGDHMVGLNERVDGLSDDMRLRFRQVNDRLSGLAA
jgi:hypothetical protein